MALIEGCANVCCPRNGKLAHECFHAVRFSRHCARWVWEGEVGTLASPDTGQNRWERRNGMVFV